MCALIEEYANERAVDVAIDICIEHGDTKEETITFVSKKFPQVSEQHISERISELWKKK